MSGNGLQGKKKTNLWNKNDESESSHVILIMISTSSSSCP